MTDTVELIVEPSQGDRYAEWFTANGYSLTISWMGDHWCVHAWHPDQPKGLPYSNGSTIATALHHAYLAVKAHKWMPTDKEFKSGSRY